MTTRAPEVLNKVLKKAPLAVCNQPTTVQKEMYTTQTSKMSYNVIIRIVNCIAYALSMSTFQAANTKCQQFTSLQTRSLVPAVEQTRYKGGELSGSFHSVRRIGNNCNGEPFLRQGRSRAS